MTDRKRSQDNIDWRLTTFDGVRREQLRRWAALSLEQMLMAQEEMSELSQVLAGSPASSRGSMPGAPRGATLETARITPGKKRYTRPGKRLSSVPARIFQIKVTLQHIRRPIWRRFQVAADTKLPRLHRILQVVMGWDNCHLHAFITGDISYGEPDPDFPGGSVSERNVRLEQIAAPGGTLRYEYDFGDSWDHVLKIEKVVTPAPGAKYPVCIAGARACPPEDCGGVWGYQNLVEAINNPAHEEHEELLEWAGEGWDPEHFDLAGINQELKSLS